MPKRPRASVNTRAKPRDLENLPTPERSAEDFARLESVVERLEKLVLQMQGGEVASHGFHTPEVAGSNPAPATKIKGWSVTTPQWSRHFDDEAKAIAYQAEHGGEIMKSYLVDQGSLGLRLSNWRYD